MRQPGQLAPQQRHQAQLTAPSNAACESAIGTIKLELVEQHVFAIRDIARLRAFDYIEAFYNPLRMHTTL